MEQATVIFLRKNSMVCLARKKGHVHGGGKSLDAGDGNWNGAGGKLLLGETIEQTAIREVKEEFCVKAETADLIHTATIEFFWNGNQGKQCDMQVYFYFLEVWQGEPSETLEMGKPQFFEITDIPYQEMLPADRLFLPDIFLGKFISGKVWFPSKNDSQGKIRTELSYHKTPK